MPTKPEFSTYSGTMRVSASDALTQTGLREKVSHGQSYNGWAAVQTLKYAPSISNTDFTSMYGINKHEAKALSRIMYGK